MGTITDVSKIIKYGVYIAVAALVFSLGFFTGRKTIEIPKPKIEIRYIKGKTVTEVIKIPPIPMVVKYPADTADIIRTCVADGIYKELWPKEKEYILPTREDTLAILSDWAAKRYYVETLFDSDTLGTCTVNAAVQYNRISSLGYDFTPVIATEKQTIYQVKKFSPFFGAGAVVGFKDANPKTFLEVSGGAFINDKYGFQIRYQSAFQQNTRYLGGSALFKF